MAFSCEEQLWIVANVLIEMALANLSDGGGHFEIWEKQRGKTKDVRNLSGEGLLAS